MAGQKRRFGWFVAAGVIGATPLLWIPISSQARVSPGSCPVGVPALDSAAESPCTELRVPPKKNKKKEKPRPRLLALEPNQVLSGTTVIMAVQLNRRVAPRDIASARFEYSTDRSTWKEISTKRRLLNRVEGDLSRDIWATRWDTRPLASGRHFIRVTMRTKRAAASSPATPVLVNKDPIPVAQAMPLPAVPRQLESRVVFDASASHDDDGQIVEWLWDFGDGTNGAGSSVQHVYADPTITHEVVLTVRDDRGTAANDHYTLSLLPVFAFQDAGGCRCKNIVLRGDDANEKGALGPDADGKKPWKPLKGTDGKTLGPRDSDPANPKMSLGNKQWTGYSFEIVCDVEGNPDKCAEVQLVRATWNWSELSEANCKKEGGTWDAKTRRCTTSKGWRGTTFDRDKDGKTDLDVSTPEKCKKAGGVWNKEEKRCYLSFPAGDKKPYGPDTDGPDKPGGDDPGGAYESKYDYKQRPDKKIIWYDSPSTRGYVDVVAEYDFIAIVRGDDGKACYVAFTVKFHEKNGKDEESLKQTDQKNGVDKVPGVP